MNKIALCLTALALIHYLFSSAQNGQQNVFENTITAKLFDIDSLYMGSNFTERNRCKSLMNSAVQKIRNRYTSEQIKNADFNTGEDILKIIDSTFTEYGFLYRNYETKESDFLTFAFTPAHSDSTASFYGNEYRRSFWNQHTGEKHYLIDCDVYCETYIGIAQMVELNVKMCEMPQHNYLRFYDPKGKYFCWDTNKAMAYSDDNFSSNYDMIEPAFEGQFLLDLNDEEITAYYYLLWSYNFIYSDKERDTKKAKMLLEKSLNLNPNSTRTICSYVWLCIMNSELDTTYQIDDLIAWIDKAISLEKNLNFYDAKACLYAMKGNFYEAIKIEKMGLNACNDRFKKRKKAEHHLKCFREGEVGRTITE